MSDVRAVEAPKLEGQCRRDPHPAIAERGGEVGHPRAVDDLDLRPPPGRLGDVPQRRRDDVDRLAALDETGDELPCDDDRAAERVRGPVGRGREKDPQRPLHGPGPYSGIVYGPVVTTGRPRILVLNQYYWPGVEATAQLLSQLCEALAEDYDLTVVTGHLHGHGDLPSEEVRNGVRILRVRSTTYDRSQLHLRAMNYASYLGDTVLTALRGTRPDLVLCMTDPPVVGDIGLLVARRFGVPLLVISQDVFPEIAERVKRLEQPLVVGALRKLVALYLRRADRVVAIGETMKQRLEDKGAPARARRGDPELGRHHRARATAARRNAWSSEQGLDDSFVVMHSGNVGHAQDLDTLVRAATFLRDLDRLRILVVGFGARHGELTQLAERLEVKSMVRFLGYQPRRRLSLSLGAADLHFVGLARGLSGFVVPSRLYGDPRRRTSGARLRRRGQRDREARPRGRLRCRRPARPSRARRHR